MFYCDLSKIDDIRAIIDKLKNNNHNISLIISFVDPFCALASKLSKEYGNETFTSEGMSIIENKLLSRDALKSTNYIPRFKIITKEYLVENPQSGYEKLGINPSVIKYTNSNGSKDVYYCDSVECYQRITKKLFSLYPNGKLLVEEYLDGPQYIVETMFIQEKLYIVAIIEQEITYTNEHFIITGYDLLLSYSSKIFSDLKTVCAEILKLHELTNGPSHLEMRYVRGQWKVIEINPRISGGGMSKLLKIGLGIDLPLETIKFALNKDFDLEAKFYKPTFAEYVILNRTGILRSITGKSSVLASSGVEYVFIKPKRGTLLTPPNSLGGRYAYVIATGKNKREARENAKSAAGKIIFHLEA
jgi:biotin carboxylase